MVWFCSNYSITFGIFFSKNHKRQKKRENQTAHLHAVTQILKANFLFFLQKLFFVKFFFFFFLGAKRKMQQKFNKQEIELFFCASQKQKKNTNKDPIVMTTTTTTTGPMYQIYNEVLRKVGEDSSYRGKFTTTLHLISRGLIKLSKLQKVAKLYRGVGGGGKVELPERCSLLLLLFCFFFSFHFCSFPCLIALIFLFILCFQIFFFGGAFKKQQQQQQQQQQHEQQQQQQQFSVE